MQVIKIANIGTDRAQSFGGEMYTTSLSIVFITYTVDKMYNPYL